MTHKLLQKGEVLSCISTMEKTFTGCCIEKLGEVDYLLVCSPDFYNQYFKKVKNNHNAWIEALKQAPSLLFNQYDQLNFRFMDKFYNFQANIDNCHIIPSVKGFKQMCLKSKGYALLPKPDILNEITNNKLIILDHKNIWKMPLFWHYWDLPDDIYHKVITDMISKSRQILLEISNHPI